MNCFPKSQNFWIWRAEWNVHGIVAPRSRREFVRPDRNVLGNAGQPTPPLSLKFQVL